jgi:hypothetical protein
MYVLYPRAVPALLLRQLAYYELLNWMIYWESAIVDPTFFFFFPLSIR